MVSPSVILFILFYCCRIIQWICIDRHEETCQPDNIKTIKTSHDTWLYVMGYAWCSNGTINPHRNNTFFACKWMLIHTYILKCVVMRGNVCVFNGTDNLEAVFEWSTWRETISTKPQFIQWIWSLMVKHSSLFQNYT